MSTRNVILIISIVVIAFLASMTIGVVALIMLGKSALNRVQVAIDSMGPATAEPGVVLGEEKFSRSQFLTDGQLGIITDIIAKPTPDAAFGIAGTSGAVFVDQNGTVKSRVTFGSATSVKFVDIEGDGVWEYLDRGGVFADASLMDQRGAVLWTCGGTPGLNSLAAGDLDGDDVLDFVAGFKGNGGLCCLDEKGIQKWKKVPDGLQLPEGDVWHVEIVDIDGDGKSEIVHCNATGALKVRDAKGTVIRECQLQFFFSDFSLCPWPSRNDRKFPIMLAKEQILVVDYDGTILNRWDAEGAPQFFGSVIARHVRLRPDESDYLAVAVDSQFGGSVLFIYSPKLELEYHEVLAGRACALLPVPKDESGVEDLLVSENGTIWKYSKLDKPVEDPADAEE